MIASAEGASEESLERFMQDPQKIKEFRPNFGICVIESPVPACARIRSELSEIPTCSKSHNKTPHVLRAIPNNSKHSFASAAGASGKIAF